MTKAIIFEGINEIIIGLKKDGKKIKDLWFEKGGRNIKEYDVYVCDLSDGVSIDSKVRIGTADALVWLEDYHEKQENENG